MPVCSARSLNHLSTKLFLLAKLVTFSEPIAHLNSFVIVRTPVTLPPNFEGVTNVQQSTGLLSQYSQEKCGYCGGQRVTQDSGKPCQPCQGRGIVFVLRPPHVCPRCGGNGRPRSAKELTYNIYYCSVCLGTGWIMTELHVASSEPVE